MRRDLREEVHLDQAMELPWGEFVFFPQRFQQRRVQDLGGRDADAALPGREFGVQVSGEGDLGQGAVGEQVGVVAVIAQVVEGFAGVFDGDFEAGGGGEEGFGHGGVETGAVGVVLVGREDEELGDACSGREG